ncbi:MAG: zinc ribbon domain-containing protein [Lachnospiraceae bacterium]|nr:zinc ribbon domain-containing protein [Lachnospiraceae bacterium]
MNIQITCPSCGSLIEIDNSREFMFCRYCGTKIYGASVTGANMGYAQNAGYGAEQSADPYEEYGAGANVDFAPISDAGYPANANTGYVAAQNYQPNTGVQQYQAPNAANLTITYSTTQPQYPLTVVIGADKWVFPDQASQGFSMAPGVYTLTFYIARRGWRKIVNIPPGNVPVRVSVVYAGRTHIYIQ